MDDLVVPVVWLKWITISSFTKKKRVIFKLRQDYGGLGLRGFQSFVIQLRECVERTTAPPRGWTLGETVGVVSSPTGGRILGEKLIHPIYLQ